MYNNIKMSNNKLSVFDSHVIKEFCNNYGVKKTIIKEQNIYHFRFLCLKMNKLMRKINSI